MRLQKSAPAWASSNNVKELYVKGLKLIKKQTEDFTTTWLQEYNS